MNQPNKEQWEERFNEEYPIGSFLNGYESSEFDPEIIQFRDGIKDFISKERTLAKEEVLRGVGPLRRWLNEDRIKDPQRMVSNEDLLHWLTPPTQATPKEKLNGACVLDEHDKCPIEAEGYKCTCECHTAPFECPDPELKRHCSGCTDRYSEGTHAGCTIEHGHVGCDLSHSKSN